MKKYIYILFLCFYSNFLFAQDIHFSNFHTNVLNLNPAFAGYFKGKQRISLTYRDQYRTVAVPYQTFSVGYDTKYSQKYNLRSSFGYGIILNYDVAGDANLQTIQCNVPIAFQTSFAKKKIYFSYAIMPAIVYNGIDFTYLKFPEQFNGFQYDPNIVPSENFENPHATIFNLGTGFQTTYKHSKDFSYTLGAAAFNITKPNVSFLDNEEIYLTPRFLIHAMGILSVNPELDIIPACKIQYQGSQKEYHFGSLFTRYLDNLNVISISGGGWFRSRDKDALILGLGCNYAGYDILCNYDINISDLKQASNGHGAFELTVSSVFFDFRKKKKMSSIKCPSYL